MTIKRIGSVAAVALAGSIILSSCAANEGTPANGASEPTEGGTTLSGTLNASGASSQQAAQEAWVASFQDANPDVTINYDPTGSGTGRDQFVEGAVNFIGSDRAFNDEELAAGAWGACAPESGIVEVPLYISPIAVVFNLEGVDSLNLDAATIAGIFLGQITSWDDPAIAALNEGVELPDTAISPVHRADDSGTTENFTDYLFTAAPDVWTAEPDGVWPLDGGEAAQGTSGLVDAVNGGEGTIGYADASRAGDLGTVSVQVGDEFVSYSPEAAAALVDASPLAEGRGEGDLAVELDRTTEEAGVYPIALISYLIGCEQYEDENIGALVSAYFSFMASEEGQRISAEQAGSAPISEAVRGKIEGAIALIE